MGPDSCWDSHDNIDNRWALSRNLDRPIAAPVTDLKSRGLLDETLIFGYPEFGHRPGRTWPRGRGHHSRCSTYSGFRWRCAHPEQLPLG